MALFYICLLALSAGAQTADEFYADRVHLASAQQAAAIWTENLQQQPGSFEAAWKLARACYWLGSHAAPSERRTFLDRGIAAGRKAAALQPASPEGHFWTAASMGALAESFGLSQGLKYRGTIRQELETTLRLDPGFMDGSADRALGRWYFKVPRLFGGSNKRAEEHLRASLAYNMNSTISLVFLAEVLLDEHRTGEARVELQKVLDAPVTPEWEPEDQEFKSRARELLSRLK